MIEYYLILCVDKKVQKPKCRRCCYNGGGKGKLNLLYNKKFHRTIKEDFFPYLEVDLSIQLKY